MNKILKGLVSGFTSLSMCAACMMSIPVKADEYEDVEMQATNRTLSVDFMGRGATPADTSPGKAGFSKNDVDLTNPLEFWVGVGVENVSDLQLFSNGIYSLDIAFEYDPNYIKPYWDKATASTTEEQSWNDELVKGNLSGTGDSSAWWDDSQYEITSVRETDIDTTLNDRENSTEAVQRVNDGWKMCYVGVTFKGSSSNLLRFNGLADNTKQYLLKLPFVLLNAPDETAADQNPTVLSMIRGGDTFAIGSGGDGTSPYASWFATTHPAPDDTNLKNLFDFSGDISLFGTNDAIDDIVAVAPGKIPSEPDATPEPGATPTPDEEHKLSSSKDLTLDGFKAETKTYYVSVPNETEQIRMDVSSSEKPTITANSTSVNVTSSGNKKYSSDLFDLNELDKTVNDGYNNTVTITAGGTTYTVYIRRLLKPKITLNYGNSPYGEIMKASNIADSDKQKAKDAFDVNNKYDANYLPSDVADKIKFSYTVQAWGNEENLDKNEYAIFVYNKEDFREPGFDAEDSLGNSVLDTDVERQITVYRMGFDGVQAMLKQNLTKDDIIIQNKGNNSLYDEITSKSKKSIQPDVYYMEYSFVDPNTNEKVSILRPVVVLWDLGDTDMSTIINPSDITFEYSVIKNKVSFKDVPDVPQRLYIYRIADVDLSSITNPSDITALYSIVKGKASGRIYRTLN